MSLDALFQLAGLVALLGWLSLLANPLVPAISDRISGIAIPALLAIAYAGLIMVFWGSGQGGFGSLDEVALLFQSRPLLLAGWIHYLAFDLFVGAWIVRAGRTAAVPFWLVVPCLVLTFLFGPAGLLVFLAIRAARAPGAALATA